MRGRANDPVVRRAKASRHAKRAHFCSCGKIVHGNGGKASHAAGHQRLVDRMRTEQDFHGISNPFAWISAEQHKAKFPGMWA